MRVIIKYKNGKLYDTKESKYIKNLNHLIHLRQVSIKMFDRILDSYDYKVIKSNETKEAS